MPAIAPEVNCRRARVWLCVALAAVTVAVYWPVAQFEFVSFDDQEYVAQNNWVARGLTWPGILWALQTGHCGNWHPLTWLSHMLDVQLFGLQPGLHHLVNLGFHTANALLLFLLLQRMTGALWRSAFVAALFALHPLHVESVAWVSERKDVLSTFFGLLAIWAYFRYAEQSKVQCPKSDVQGSEFEVQASRLPSSIRYPPSSLFYLLSLLLFALSLMSKPMLVTLPCLLLLLDYWPLKRLQLRAQNSQLKTLPALLLEKLPFFALSAASSVITLVAQRGGGAVTSVETLPLPLRAASATMAYLFYLAKTVWPHGLAVFYPYRADWDGNLVGLGGLILLGLTAAAALTARRRPYLFVGWLWFLGTLVPTIGLVQVGAQAMADRYTYLPLAGLFIAVAWGTTEWVGSRRWGRIGLVMLAGAAILAAMTTCRRQVLGWKSTETLCRQALGVTPHNFVAHGALGVTLADQGRYQQAEPELAAALAINPDYCPALIALAQIRLTEGRDAEAAGLLEQTLKVRADRVLAHRLLARAMARQKKPDAARQHLEEAVRLDPFSVEARDELAGFLVANGQADAALEQALAALSLDPDSPDAHFNAGSALFLQGKLEQAVVHYRAACKANPDFAEAYLDCGKAFLAMDKLAEAEESFGAALRRRPDSVEAHRALAAVYSRQGRSREQAGEYAELLRLRPDWPEVQNNLAWLLATDPNAEVRDGPRAVSLAERACQLTQATNAAMVATLAAAYAEAGRFPDAINTQEKACGLAAAQRQTNQVQAFQIRLELYRSGHAYHRP